MNYWYTLTVWMSDYYRVMQFSADQPQAYFKVKPKYPAKESDFKRLHIVCQTGCVNYIWNE